MGRSEYQYEQPPNPDKLDELSKKLKSKLLKLEESLGQMWD